MKRFLTALTMFAAVAAVPAIAQTGITASIEHDFVLAGKLMPAGNYDIVQGPTQATVKVRNANRQDIAMVFAGGPSFGNPDDSHLTLKRFGEKYYLTSYTCLGNTRELWNRPPKVKSSVVLKVKAVPLP
jgi:hypothetical protein